MKAEQSRKHNNPLSLPTEINGLHHLQAVFIGLNLNVFS